MLAGDSFFGALRVNRRIPPEFSFPPGIPPSTMSCWIPAARPWGYFWRGASARSANAAAHECLKDCAGQNCLGACLGTYETPDASRGVALRRRRSLPRVCASGAACFVRRRLSHSRPGAGLRARSPLAAGFAADLDGLDWRLLALGDPCSRRFAFAAWTGRRWRRVCAAVFWRLPRSGFSSGAAGNCRTLQY